MGPGGPIEAFMVPFTLGSFIQQAGGADSAARNIQDGCFGPGVLVGEVPPDDLQAWPRRTPMGIVRSSLSVMEAGISMDMLCIPLRPRRLEGLLGSHLRVGRADNNDIVLAHSTVSRLHAVITTRMDRVELADSGSSQGTWVNDLQVQQGSATPLWDRDRVTMGAVQLRYLRATTVLALLQDKGTAIPAR